jgi:transposase-like protein
MADQSAMHLAAAHNKKAELSVANKAVHAFGGEAAVLESIASGCTISALCKVLGVAVTTFDRWVDRGGEARRSAYAHARTRAAQSLAEQTIDIADAATVQEVQLAKLRSDNRWKMAAKLNPETYGDKQQPLVSINLGDMALDALRKRVIVMPVNGTDTDDLIEG